MFGRAAIDLVSLHKNPQCPLFFSLVRDDVPMGVDALVHLWPNALWYTFPPESDHAYSKKSPELAREVVADTDNSTPMRPA